MFTVAHCSCNQDTAESLEHIRLSVHNVNVQPTTTDTNFVCEQKVQILEFQLPHWTSSSQILLALSKPLLF